MEVRSEFSNVDPIFPPTLLSYYYQITFPFTTSLIYTAGFSETGRMLEELKAEQRQQKGLLGNESMVYRIACVHRCSHPSGIGCHWRKILEDQYPAANDSNKNRNTEDKWDL